MLDRDSLGQFIEREKKQGKHLRRALLGRHQRAFRRPKQELRRLRAKQSSLLNAHNPYARVRWLRALGGHLCERLGAQAPHWEPDQPVYFLTLIDRKQVWDPASEHVGPSLKAMTQRYSRLLPFDLNYVGMVEPAYYAYVRRVLGYDTVLLFHAHCLVWGVNGSELDEVCQRIRGKIKPLLPYATSARWDRISDGDLLQMLWYIAKMPRNQHQLSRKPTGALRQYKARINGVNAVRLYAEMHNVTLDQLTIGGGKGMPILQALDEDARRWQRKAHRKGYI